MVVPRTPRPPIIVPKPAQPAFDPAEIERWVGRLARAIRLKRLEERFLGAQRDTETIADVAGTLKPDDGDIGSQRR
jgi:hypothetical protein